MAVYAIILREGPFTNPAEYQEYMRMLGENKREFKIKPLAMYGALEACEGRLPDGAALLEFPTMEDAKEWYFSPEYQGAAAHRIKSADYRIMLVQGM